MQNIDPALAVAIAAAIVIAVAAIHFVVRRLLVRERERAGQDGTALAERLRLMGEEHRASREALERRLLDQERALGERLAEMGRQVGKSLESSGEKTQATMTDLRLRLARIDEAQKSLAELSGQVVGLQEILSNKQARGAFGEIQLKDLVESILPPSACEFQATIGGNRRVDCLLRLPQPPGPIGIDAKFPLEGWQALRAAEDEPARVRARRDFSTAVLKHVRDIAEKYIVPGETAEAALMFLPSEAIYADLHAHFPDVIEQSFRARVYIVSPTTLWATLNTVRAIFRDVRMREQAHIIQSEMHVLLKDVARLDQRVVALDKHFGLARRDIEEINTSTRKIVSRAGKMTELELAETGDEGAGEAVPPAPPVDRLAGE